MQLLKKLVNTLFLSESATGSISVEGLVSSPRVVGAQRVLKVHVLPLAPTCMAADGIYKADQECIMEGIRLVAA